MNKIKTCFKSKSFHLIFGDSQWWYEIKQAISFRYTYGEKIFTMLNR